LGVEPKNILIVGEDANTRSTLMRTLQHNGFAVEGSSDARQALGRMPRGGLDLIVAVTENGQGSGVELLDAVGRMSTPVPVILVSVCGTVAAAVEAIQRGARDFLVLPVEPERLTASARAAIAAGEAVLHGTQGPEHRLGQKSFLTHDPHLLEVLAMARQVARSTATVLIQGESGTGMPPPMRSISRSWRSLTS